MFLSKKTGNQFKRMPYKIGPKGFCKYFNDEDYFVQDLRKVSNYPPVGTCPWPKGKYTIDDYSVRFLHFDFISFHINLIIHIKLNITSFPPVLGTGKINHFNIHPFYYELLIFMLFSR